MMDTEARPLVIYHGNCADGFSAAWCFWRKYGTAADYVAGAYQQEPPDVRGREVYLVDFSYKRAVVERMLAEANSVCLIVRRRWARQGGRLQGAAWARPSGGVSKRK